MPPESPLIEVRQLCKLTEFEEVVRLQREIWGFDDLDLLPLRLFVVASKIGGQLLGGFVNGKMVGFVLCIPGLKPGGKQFLHGHMLGVLPDFRNTGLGRRMKLEQRAYALATGIDLIEWTFDPLELKNASFNIERLGVIVRRYVHNQYGTTSSHLHAGLPTDRLVAEWWVGSKHVESLAAGRTRPPRKTVERISVPADIARIKRDDPARARDLQRAISIQFDELFRSGLTVLRFERNDAAGTYLLGPWESK